MKQNGNDQRTGEYYIGLDVGTNSVGWALTDKDYKIQKFKGKDMWGARLFDDAKDASERRTARTARRRLDRRNQRLHLLELLFAEEIHKVDPDFFMRMHESFLQPEDRRDQTSIYSLFNDAEYTDKDYLKKYPTIYHLRSELIHSSEPHDIRLVFLALHHLVKYRGHFLYENSGDSEGKTIDEAFEDFKNVLNNYDVAFEPADFSALKDVLNSDDSLTVKKKNIKAAYGDAEDDNSTVDMNSLLELLTGAKVQLVKLFGDDSLKNADIPSISLLDELDSKLDTLGDELDDMLDVITAAKEVFDVARLGKILGDQAYISDAKIDLYNKNRKDTQILKKYIKKNSPGEYKAVFNAAPGVKNFAVYMRYKTKESCTQDEFCSYLKNKVKGMETSENEDERRVYQEIISKTFLTKLKGTDNGLIPYQLELKEVNAILSNAEEYLTFLKDRDDTGLTVSEKIRSIFTFKIPYYVGPLNRNAKHFWAVRSDEKVYPWNFSDVIDEKQTANAFMENLIGRCTYTGEYVLPMNSLLYSEFTVLNEINTIKINGNPITVEAKQIIFTDLFLNSKKKVTKKTIFNCLKKEGMITQNDEISGIDDTVKSNLKSFHDFRQILDRTNDREQVEDIIRSILVFGDNKKMLRTWLKENTHDLTENDIKYILRLKYTGWARLSKEFLIGIYHIDENGEAFNIMDMLSSTNKNLMKLMSKDYQFAEKAEAYRKEHNPLGDTIRARLDELYIAPAVRRSIWQTLRIVDELVDIRKAAPEKIFIEMARGSAQEMKNKRTESRKEQLTKLYQSCKAQEKELYGKLESETDQTLRRDKLYLYYLQMGRCMYSGDPIDLDKLLNDNETYDIDHIYPRSRIKDNSLNNRVLVKSTLNRSKTNIYPISEEIRSKMKDFWNLLRQKGLLSDEKYNRLVRSYGLTDEELSSFVARQLVSTQQSTKALADMLQTAYPNTRIVYSKAGNVSDFRQEFNIIKCREINDLHHAKDAYLNIVVGNVYDTKFTEKFFLNIRSENYSLNKVFNFNTPGAWNADGSSIKTVKKYVQKNSPIVTFMPVEAKGAISNLQIVPKKQGQLPIKEGLSIEKYGGYNSLSGAYFCVVEHSKGKKRVRTIEPVYVYKKSLFETSSVKYCEEILNLISPKIICTKVYVNSLIELNGERLAITSRTEDRNLYKHTYQFAVDDNHSKYIKEIMKFIDRCQASNCIYTKGEFINKEDNQKLYDWLVERLHGNVYYSLNPIQNVCKALEENREKFNSMDLLDQSLIIREIIKTFRCNSVWSNFKTLNGKGQVGILKFSKTISNNTSAVLIHQSVTGLYEVYEDLLK